MAYRIITIVCTPVLQVLMKSILKYPRARAMGCSDGGVAVIELREWI
jgi:hypothetical protein